METSFIKKIVSVEELKEVTEDIKRLFHEDNENYGHRLGLKHDMDLIIKSISHESLLIWNIHFWAHYNGNNWDGVFIGMIRKSEKFNKKIMDEYLWLSKNSNSGMKLYKTALDFAKNQNCDYITMNIVEDNPFSEKLRKIYRHLGFEKDSESYVKKLI